MVLVVQGVLPKSKGLTIAFTLGALTIMTTVIRFASLKIGTGQENLVCKLSTPPSGMVRVNIPS